MSYNIMLDNIIRKYGFEANQTIIFAVAIENDIMSARDIELFYDILMVDGLEEVE